MIKRIETTSVTLCFNKERAYMFVRITDFPLFELFEIFRYIEYNFFFENSVTFNNSSEYD